MYIGDGRSDREAAAEADLVFAKNELADYCQENGIKALKFNNFADICSQILNERVWAVEGQSP